MKKRIINLYYLLAGLAFFLMEATHPIFERLLGGWGQYELRCGGGGYCTSGELGMCIDRFGPPDNICLVESSLALLFALLIIIFLIIGIVSSIKVAKYNKTLLPKKN